jgi:hypothetical protein
MVAWLSVAASAQNQPIADQLPEEVMAVFNLDYSDIHARLRHDLFLSLKAYLDKEAE